MLPNMKTYDTFYNRIISQADFAIKYATAFSTGYIIYIKIEKGDILSPFYKTHEINEHIFK